VEIIFSRHARRRGKLYRISQETVRKVLKGKKLKQGKQEFTENIPGFQYPLKVIVSVDGARTTVITSYPLKKGSKK